MTPRLRFVDDFLTGHPARPRAAKRRITGPPSRDIWPIGGRAFGEHRHGFRGIHGMEVREAARNEPPTALLRGANQARAEALKRLSTPPSPPTPTARRLRRPPPPRAPAQYVGQETAR